MSTRETILDAGAPMSLPASLILAEPELRAAFIMMLEQRRPQLERVAMSMLRCQQDAEDIVQESVMKALRFLPRFRGDARIDTWLHTIVVNTARDWLRLRRQRAQVPLEAESEEWEDILPFDVPHPGPNPEEFCRRRELLRLLQEEVRRLDPIYRMPICICDLEGRSYREAALMLQLTGPAIKARLFRGRLLLKKRLSRHSRLSLSPASDAHKGRSPKQKSRYAARGIPAKTRRDQGTIS